MLNQNNVWMSSKRCCFCKGCGLDNIGDEYFTCYACHGTGFVKSEPVNLLLVTCGAQPFEKAID